MTSIAFAMRPGAFITLRQRFVAILAVDMVSRLEFQRGPFFSQGVVALAAFCGLPERGPDVCAILINVVAIPTRNLVLAGVFCVAEFHRTFSVFLIALVLNPYQVLTGRTGDL
jgi:hypothetical protein